MSCLTHNRSRDGFALPVALITIMVIGALVTGGFYLSARDGRASTRADLGEQALYVAEYGVDRVLGTWVRDSLVAAIRRTEARGDLGATGVRTISGVAGHYTLRVERLGQGLALVRSRGAVQQGPARAAREVGAVVRTTAARLPYPAALTVLGAVTLDEGVRVDATGAEVVGCPVRPAVPGLVVRDSARVSRGVGSEITGSPAVLQVATMTADSLGDLGMATIRDLVASATRVYEHGAHESGMGPATTAGPEGSRCDTSVRKNWGDPRGTGPCAHHLPIIHARGDLTLDGGRGQGILVVEGDLTAAGDVRFGGV
ncbi:MAG: hypothetical protein GWM90_22340, partial [Gemmatimonadetes bacterium]|nr:hypothetical protein [Gemmatimonadota bacterium]NIQ57350.1 hypothetical protein [Gemmatimonadota bacterium]NIU77513.1 hypothetical protein [Gammaproteobacteria bacterium]NIX46721.1 hypothetical protein [Gemmatimonadota bacterium]NIY11069.1 hypothetical protein [Gemmatimonadota bacterium]